MYLKDQHHLETFRRNQPDSIAGQFLLRDAMLIQESFVDVPTKADGDGSMRRFNIFPGVLLALHTY